MLTSITHWTALLLVAGLALVGISGGVVPGTGLAVETGTTGVECVRQMPRYRPNPAINC